MVGKEQEVSGLLGWCLRPWLFKRGELSRLLGGQSWVWLSAALEDEDEVLVTQVLTQTLSNEGQAG